MRNNRLIVASILCLYGGKALAFPQYKLELQSSLAPGASNFAGQNLAGDLCKPYVGNKVLLRMTDGGIVTSQTAAPFGYGIGSGRMCLSESGTLFGRLTYVEGGGTKSKPMAWSETGGFEVLPDLITTPPNPNYSYYMNTASPDGSVVGGALWFLAGNSGNYTPTRFRKFGGMWTAEFFPGEGEVLAVDSDGTAYGRFNGAAGIWHTDGSFDLLPAPFQGNQNHPWTLAAGFDANGLLYGQGLNEIWVWSATNTQPTRYTMPQTLSVEANFLHINKQGTGVFRSASGATSTGFYWSAAEGVANIDSLLLPQFAADFSVVAPQGIDNQGRIRALAMQLSTNELRGVYLAPVPEPATLLLMSVGIGYLVARRRNRR